MISTLTGNEAARVLADPESLRSRSDANPLRKVLVVGTFRSGTNLTRYCLQRFFRTDSVFNEWFWKHGVPPTGIQRPIPSDVPIVVMSKDPCEVNVSLYRFWQARRPELAIGNSLSEFIRRRVVVYDNSRANIDPKYYYLTPTEYWNQFYYSWLNWAEVETQRVFLRCEDLLSAPDKHLSAIAERFGLERRLDGPITLPDGRIGPTPSREIRSRNHLLSDTDLEWIRSLVDNDVARSLGYSRYA